MSDENTFGHCCFVYIGHNFSSDRRASGGVNEDFEMEDKLGGGVNISRLSANVSLMLLSRPTPATNRYPPHSNSFSTYSQCVQEPTRHP